MNVKQKEKDRSIIFGMATRITPSGASAARERLLRTASELFYREGIHSVGVDRIVAAAGVTRATFYRHFPSKEDLVEAYLGVEDALIRGAFDAARAATDDPEAAHRPRHRGHSPTTWPACTRAAAPSSTRQPSIPIPTSRVRQAVGEHREWFRSTLEALLDRRGRRRPDDRGRRARAAARRRDGRRLPRRLGACASRVHPGGDARRRHRRLRSEIGEIGYEAARPTRAEAALTKAASSIAIGAGSHEWSAPGT